MWRCNHTVVTPVTTKLNAFLRSKKCDHRLRYKTSFTKVRILVSSGQSSLWSAQTAASEWGVPRGLNTALESYDA